MYTGNARYVPAEPETVLLTSREASCRKRLNMNVPPTKAEAMLRIYSNSI